jgi:hypothetical protein
MTTAAAADNNNKQHQRRKELKDKVGRLAKTVHEIEPSNRPETMAAIDRILYLANIHALKEFLIDRDYKGEKPRIMVESPYTPPETGIPEDRVYLAYNIPEYHQEMLDMLKKQQLVPDDSTIEDYAFLFNNENATAEEEEELKA